jgi:hypothetical protein
MRILRASSETKVWGHKGVPPYPIDVIHRVTDVGPVRPGHESAPTLYTVWPGGSAYRSGFPTATDRVGGALSELRLQLLQFDVVDPEVAGRHIRGEDR